MSRPSLCLAGTGDGVTPQEQCQLGPQTRDWQTLYESVARIMFPLHGAANDAILVVDDFADEAGRDGGTVTAGEGDPTSQLVVFKEVVSDVLQCSGS